MWYNIPILVSCLAICSAAQVVSFPLEKRTSLNARDDPSGPLQTDKNHFYMLELEFGSEGQKVKVAADTGSANLWVSQDAYNTDNSPSWKSYLPDLPLSYGSLQGRFDLGYDWITFGGQKYNATVGSAYSLTGTVTTGILGLSYPDENSSADYSNAPDIKFGYDTLPYILKKSGQTASVAYAFWLSDDAATGELLFGGIDHSRYTGTLQRVPVLTTFGFDPVNEVNVKSDKPTYLSIALNKISLNTSNVSGNIITGANFPVLLDSGTPALIFPSDIASAIKTSLGLDPNLPIMSEKPTGSITFDFSGIEIEVQLADMVTEVDGAYLLPIQSNGNEHVKLDPGIVYIIGTPVLRNAYVVFDLENDEIALAPVVHTPGDSQVEALSTGIPGDKAERYSSTSVNSMYTLYTLSPKTTSSA